MQKDVEASIDSSRFKSEALRGLSLPVTIGPEHAAQMSLARQAAYYTLRLPLMPGLKRTGKQRHVWARAGRGMCPAALSRNPD